MSEIGRKIKSVPGGGWLVVLNQRRFVIRFVTGFGAQGSNLTRHLKWIPLLYRISEREFGPEIKL